MQEALCRSESEPAPRLEGGGDPKAYAQVRGRWVHTRLGLRSRGGAWAESGAELWGGAESGAGRGLNDSRT